MCLFSTCKKENSEDHPNSFPAKFSAERIELKKETRVFTQAGEIKDQKLIDQFNETLNWPQKIEEDFQNGRNELNFKFTTDSTVNYSWDPFSGAEKSTTYRVQRKGNRFLFTSLEEFPIHANMAPEGNEWGYLYHILKYKEPINPILPKSANPLYTHATKNVRVSHGNFKVMKAACFDYYLIKETTENSTVFKTKHGRIFNEIEGMLGKFLGSRDTLVVKEYSTIFTIEQ